MISETWTYASVNSVTVSGDMRQNYSAGMLVKLTQGSSKYFTIVSVTYANPNTTIVLYGGGLYTLTSDAITAHMETVGNAPFGVPMAVLQVSSVLAGLCPALSGNSTDILHGDGTWSAVTGSNPGSPYDIIIHATGTVIYAHTFDGTLLSSGTLNNDDAAFILDVITNHWTPNYATILLKRISSSDHYVFKSSVTSTKSIFITSDGALLDLSNISGAFAFDFTGPSGLTSYSDYHPIGIERVFATGLSAGCTAGLIKITNAPDCAIVQNVRLRYLKYHVELDGNCYGAIVTHVNAESLNAGGTGVALKTITGAGWCPNNARIDHYEVSFGDPGTVGIAILRNGALEAAGGVSITNCWIENLTTAIISEGDDALITGNWLQTLGLVGGVGIATIVLGNASYPTHANNPRVIGNKQIYNSGSTAAYCAQSTIAHLGGADPIISGNKIYNAGNVAPDCCISLNVAYVHATIIGNSINSQYDGILSTVDEYALITGNKIWAANRCINRICYTSIVGNELGSTSGVGIGGVVAYNNITGNKFAMASIINGDSGSDSNIFDGNNCYYGSPTITWGTGNQIGSNVGIPTPLSGINLLF